MNPAVYKMVSSVYDWATTIKGLCPDFHTQSMNPEVYKKISSVDDWANIEGLCPNFHSQRTPNGNTILHVLVEFSDSFAGAVKPIAAREPRLVYKKNKEGETPLVIASRRGHCNVVTELIDSATSTSSCSGFKNKRARVLRAMGYSTAALEALRNNAHEVAKLLFKEPVNLDDVFPWTWKYMPWYIFNPRRRDSVLYLAAQKGYDDIVDLILPKSKNLTTHCGPLGRNPLHAAVFSNSPGCVEKILNKFPNMAKEVDKLGWSAIHYASMLNHTASVKKFLSTDIFSGYLRNFDTDDNMTALHIAVCFGHLNVVKEILFHCPDCWEMVTLPKRKNILHLAIEKERQEVLNFIISEPWGSGLINKKDIKGNTPLHLYVSTNKLDGRELLNDPCILKDAMNNYSLTPLDIIEDADMVKEIQDADMVERQNKIKDELLNAGATPQFPRPFYQFNKNANPSGKPENMEPYMIVAALIVTVTFAAGFTVPGGFDNKAGNEGMAVLSKDAAFTVFVVSDSLAVMFSVLAILVHLLSVIKIKWLDIEINPTCVAVFIGVSLLLMLMAFVTGLYAVLPIHVLKNYLIMIGLGFGFQILMYFFLSCIGVASQVIWGNATRRQIFSYLQYYMSRCQCKPSRVI